jgi:hypothetical protein
MSPTSYHLLHAATANINFIFVYSPMQIRIDTKEVIKFTNKLEKISRLALPMAVRGTLNSAAFDVKTNTMPKKAKDSFKERQPNFFKANSRVEKASGFDIRSMKSTVGFTEGSAKNNNYAVKELEQQESGGSIPKRSFIPMSPARGGDNSRLVKPNARLKKIKNLVDSNKVTGTTPQQRFVHAVALAGKGGFVLGNKSPKVLWRVNSINRTKDGKFKLTPVYSFSQGRKVNVPATHFMEKASTQSAEKLNDFYAKEAERQIAKVR